MERSCLEGSLAALAFRPLIKRPKHRAVRSHKTQAEMRWDAYQSISDTSRASLLQVYFSSSAFSQKVSRKQLRGSFINVSACPISAVAHSALSVPSVAGTGEGAGTPPPFSEGLVQMSLERSLPRPPEVSASDISDPLVSCHGGSEGEDLG